MYYIRVLLNIKHLRYTNLIKHCLSKQKHVKTIYLIQREEYTKSASIRLKYSTAIYMVNTSDVPY